jgi:hypothetical protein
MEQNHEKCSSLQAGFFQFNESVIVTVAISCRLRIIGDSSGHSLARLTTVLSSKAHAQDGAQEWAQSWGSLISGVENGFMCSKDNGGLVM